MMSIMASAIVMLKPAQKTPLVKLAEAVDQKVMALFAMLAAYGRPQAALEAYWRDVRAEGNPIKEIAVGFILIGVALVIALTILPVITSAVNTAQEDGNLSATDGTLLGLLPTLLIVGLLAGGVAFLFRGFKHVKG